MSIVWTFTFPEEGPMTRTVWKYTFERQQFSMTITDLVNPRVVLVGQDPRHRLVGSDPELCSVWVEHQISGEGTPPYTETLKLELYGSGDPIPWEERPNHRPLEWMGSGICGSHVWHVYKV